MRSVALTHFVNRSPEAASTPLTQRQLYNGLKLKARDPIAFVSSIERCEILNESETGLLRAVIFKGEPELVRERVEFFPPTAANFTRLSSGDEIVGHITNVISTTPDGELLLTFTFALGSNGLEDEDEAADEAALQTYDRADETIAKTISVIRNLVKEGKV